ncbi:ComEC/Rec2 family competence protein [Paracoccus sp. (in: a-proteobacteria)]|uniref:ComEC/Rec2 family competence protein n=1 Tax=Paracoccus sp. TaxID=267 RepID=UPI00321F6770
MGSSPTGTVRPPLAVRAGIMPWVPFWLSLGIGGWFLLAREPGAGFYAGLLLAAAACLAGLAGMARLAAGGRLGWRWAEFGQLALLALLLIALGAGMTGLRAHLVAAPVLDFRYYGPVEGRVIGIDRSARDRMRLLLDRVRLRNVAPGDTPRRVRISLLQDDVLPVPGQRVMLTAHLSPPPGPAEPGGFDFRRLAWFDGIGAIGYTRTPVMSVAQPDRAGTLALHRMRMDLSAAMQDRIGGQAGAVASALMTGDRSGIAEATNATMRASNLYHIVSISGLHMSMLAGLVYAGLRLLAALVQGLGGLRLPWGHKLAAVGALLVALVYLWLSGGGVATERAFITVAVMLLAVVCDRRAVSLRTVAVAAVIVLLLAPEALTEPGFQLSFAATVGLILVNEAFQNTFAEARPWLRFVALLMLSSLVAGLATAPIAAAHFGRITQYGLLANMLAVPVVGMVVMPAGIAAALLAPLDLAQPALWLMGLGTRWMLAVSEWVAAMGGAEIRIPAPPRAVLPLFGAGALLTLLAPMSAGLASRAGTVARRAGGIGLILCALGIWLGAQRPGILVSAGGDAVAVMTPAGRVPSRAKGGSFAVDAWLEADGDALDRKAAASRPLWQGVPTNRWAELHIGPRTWQIRHLVGKTALAALAQFCRQDAVLITDQRTVGKPPGDCRILDRGLLGRQGAVSIQPHVSGIRLRFADGPPARRMWQ